MHIRIKIYYTQIFNNLQTISALFKRKGNKQKHKDYEKGYSLFFGGTIRDVNSLSHMHKRGRSGLPQKNFNKKCVRNTNICY